MNSQLMEIDFVAPRDLQGAHRSLDSDQVRLKRLQPMGVVPSGQFAFDSPQGPVQAVDLPQIHPSHDVRGHSQEGYEDRENREDKEQDAAE